MSVGVALLVAALASPDSPTQAGRDKVLAAWGPTIVDVRASKQLSPDERASLEALGAEYTAEGFTLYVILVDSVGARFSIGDLTSEVRGATDCSLDCVYLSAHRHSLHSSTNWHSYKESRALARDLLDDYRRAPIPTLVRYGRQLMEEGRRRTRHRRLMLAVAAAALCGLAGVLARARFRQGSSRSL